MIDKIQLTLYEIFGYLLPGAIAAVALAIVYWAVFIPAVPFPVYKVHPDSVGWAALAAFSYMLGHVVQGVGGKYLAGAEHAAFGAGGSVPAAIVSSAKSQAAIIAGVKSDDIDANSLFRIADEYSVQKGMLGDRDVFIYREGFYKGCTVALALVCFALVVRAFVENTALRFPACTFFVSRIQLLIAALMAAGAARVCKKRFHRFGMYRVTRALFAFLALSQNLATGVGGPKKEGAHA